MAGGYMGKILNVDLTKGEIAEEGLGEELCRSFLGGYGIGVKILYDRMKPGVDPLGPDNILGFMTGPFTGTSAPIGSRFTVLAKSPLTGTWGDANCGGYFGPYLKFGGVDGVFLTGVSDRPVYLFINDGKAELRDAVALWGKDCYDTENALKKELGNDVEVACIGPAGERLSLISCVITNKWRAAGRSGLGAVMGSKRLKAIVARGKRKVPIADRDAVEKVRARLLRGEKGGYWDVARQYGTCAVMEHHALYGDAPIKNWLGAGTPGADFPPEMARKINHEAVIAYEEKKYGCWGCPLRCGGVMKLEKGEYALSKGENYRGHKPEYETLAMCGSNLLNDNLESIIKLNEICNMYGLDTISVGATIAFAMECYENGLLTKEDTDGIELRWGNDQAIVKMTERLARREGFGGILADGVKVAAEKIGKGAYMHAVHIHGQEVPAHDPRYVPGMATTYITDATPARHTQGIEDWWPFGWQERVPEWETWYRAKPKDVFPRYQYGGRGEIHKKAANYMHVINAVGTCQFVSDALPYAGALAELLSAVTGWTLGFDDCLEIGERIATVRHAFNLREGYSFLTAEVPGRIVGEPPAAVGSLKGITVDYATEIRDYLDAMGWDRATAVPSKDRLVKLGLGYMAHDLG